MKTTITYLTLLHIAMFFSGNVAANSDDAKVNLESMRLLSQAYTRIKQNHVDEVDDKELVENCIAGMASGVDPESSFLGAEKFEELKSGTKVSIGGLGLKLAVKNGYPLVITSIDGTPAYEAGIKSGDIILEIDNDDMRGVMLDNIVSRLRGEAGTSVKLKIVKKSNPESIVFHLTRRKIRINNVKQRLFDNNVGYIRISAFINNTGVQLAEKLDFLEKEAKGRLNGLVLDLRNNPGGLMSEAIVVADTFLSSGMIAYTKMRDAGSELKYMADPKQYIEGIPLVVLVNEGTAAASEIVSGALKAHQRAILIGKNTYGSGSIQTIIPLGNGSALKLTTARWVTPSGNFIHGNGIKPDISVGESTNTNKDDQLERALRYFNR